MSKHQPILALISKATQLPKFPNWYVIPQQPVLEIQADYRVETDIDVNDVGRVRVKPGYNINVEDIRYKC